jgi:CDP-6-deoxy-D-xylo-4-hexulose-3-dehydrase
MDKAELKTKILELVAEYSRNFHSAQRPGFGEEGERRSFQAGKDTVPYAGRVFTEDEVTAAVSSTLDFWLTLGKEGDAFERELARFLGVKKCILANSGSSANLLAASALTSYRLGDRALRKGDEVITVAAGFPTTVAPLIQNGLVPVFIDNDPDTLNADVRWLEQAYKPGKTRAVFMAHTLGNPFDLTAVTEFCKKHDLFLVEDNCDALGCRYDDRLTGTFGDMSTQSFYPPHHITMGEGGSVNIVNDMRFKVAVESFRDWGRDCWCPSGVDNTCGKRFDWKLGDLPEGYDHKFIYTHLGYNLKPLDLQAAIGRVQLGRLPAFVQARVDNWDYMRAGLDEFSRYFTFMLPTHAKAWKGGEFEWDASGHRTLCSWFGFMIRVRPDAPFKKAALSRYLDERKVGHRMMFGGNLLRQPVLKKLAETEPGAFRVASPMDGADKIMNEALFLGTYPGLTRPMMDYMIDVIRDFVKSKG